jgi:hypothetical protein
MYANKKEDTYMKPNIKVGKFVVNEDFRTWLCKRKENSQVWRDPEYITFYDKYSSLSQICQKEKKKEAKY